MKGILWLFAALWSSPILAQANPAHELAGLWEAKKRFGPDIRGTLTIARDGDTWRGDIAGRTAPVEVRDDAVTLELANGEGEFLGKFAEGRTRITGHWIQASTVTIGEYASPVTLEKQDGNLWRGEVVPLDNAFRFYLMIQPRADGSTGAFLRNPERNLGRLTPIDAIERDGEIVRFLATPAKDEAKGRELLTGVYRNEVLTVFYPNRGGTYDFHRVQPDQDSDFYPRSRRTVYTYAPPRPRDDGWPVAPVEDVGISREAITKFIQMLIDTPIDKVSAVEMHAVLIARHGKLVLEEYFHGEHAEKPHDTRSAAKSATATLIGAAIQAGVPLSLSSPVYAVMNGGQLPPDLEPRKRALTLEHLLTQSSGLDCDDADPDSPGAEDRMTDESDEPDYYKFTMRLGVIRDPGAKAVYCSINSHLAGGVLSRAARRPLPPLFHELIAEPLQIERYHMNLTPTGDAYMGGGVRFLPRDFMKLAQLHLNGGTWNGRRVLSEEWARRATSPLYELRSMHYGYQWWVIDYPYRGRKVRAFYAGGNGGQVVIGIPELELVLAAYGGNYNDQALFTFQRVYVPEWLLPAVSEPD